MRYTTLLIVLFGMFMPSFVFGQLNFKGNDSDVTVRYGKSGFEFVTKDNKFKLQMQVRLQFRYTGLSDLKQDSILYEGESPGGTFEIQRARFKIGGHAFSPNLKYYFEYDVKSNRLLTWRATFSKNPGLQFRLGQWKINYNAERVVSSGKQLMVERSITNRYFTLDRQVGAMAFGHIFRESAADALFYLGVFNGNGIGTNNASYKYLVMGRYQWNIFQRIPKMTFNDLELTPQPAAYIAVGAARNQSAFTSFSSSGGGELPGFTETSSDRYLIHQILFETMLKYRGLTFVLEAHYKSIDDNELDIVSNIYGGYVMAGYFLHQSFSSLPEPLEVAARYSLVAGDTFNQKDIKEFTIGANWFFAGDRNKITFDFSVIRSPDLIQEAKDFRYRIQWDISI